MTQGTIKRLVADKGFGFVTYEGAEKDLFFHSNELKNAKFEDLKEGDKVSFDIADSPKGPNATNVNKED